MGGEQMTNKIKFTQVSRVIDPKTRIHYLDAIDENGIHWVAQQEIGVERWITYKETWKKDPQQPYDL
jgi:penicillin V acylase-like amidase (Ntn superfamily)